MPVLRSLFQRTLPIIRSQTGVVQRRTVMGGPPTQKVTPLDNSIAFSLLFVGMLGVPGWILSHLPDYRARPEEE